ncbi:MAG: transposase [Bacillota bacterium]
MPRQARIKAEFNTYHIIQRGNELKNIFDSDDDRIRFLETLARMRAKYNFLVYAYCLMDNHIHLIINDNGNDISKLIKSINISYVHYFNQSYNRCGHLFQDRFRSEMIQDDKYLLQASKYIHNNPVKAAMVSKAEEYEWSSYNIYTGRNKDIKKIIEKEKILGIISKNRAKAIKAYREYVLEDEIVQVMDIDENESAVSKDNSCFIKRIDQARVKIMRIAEERRLSPADIIEDKIMRNEVMVEIRKNSSLTLKQIGDIFGGLSESRVSRILKRAGC